VRDLIEELVIDGRLVAAVRALAAVHALMLVVRVDDRIGLLGRM
jgi:hypothetical protein